MKFLCTGWAEYYQWVEADTEEEARAQMEKGRWFRTMALPLQDIKVEVKELDAEGHEVKE